ncbi:hypothetical protein A4A24_08685 [Staphylococcus warneri]|uniref:hypothetical protein n=1 Tax=Staphylococcus warneri TaxID=1292 RepID=UPI00073642E4|nr:hypothetical protein [Staphylococcus warneri]KTW08579.1 hypothetical protein NS346_04445 [Staphylococcus warneri]OIS42578.1 hypothetical protein A4A23_00765 [Staphylococcus warneri]OIS45254.1 hypothetical protein A4A24_08685 [Staphylococcus warneri]QNQ44298.1 hypothetical protein IAR39_10835 [Staphylococcus warneri]
MSILEIVAIIVCSLILEFLINHRFIHVRLDAIAELGCIILTIIILDIGYQSKGHWVLAILTLFCVMIRKIRDINLSKE